MLIFYLHEILPGASFSVAVLLVMSYWCPYSVDFQELNEVAAELCEHITLFGVPHAPDPSAIVACLPTTMKVS